MSPSALSFLLLILVQTAPADSASPGSQLQFGALQAPAASNVRDPADAGPTAALSGPGTLPGALQAPASAPPRSIYGNTTEPAADSAPSLAPFRGGLAAPPATANTPAEYLLREALQEPPQEGIGGNPVGLRAVLGALGDGTRRREGVAAYWRLTHAIAAYHFALAEERFLMALAAAEVREDQLLLAAAQAAARAERAESRLAAVRAQQALAPLVAAAARGQSPLPADPPLVGVYRTYFKELNERGAAGEDLRQIDATLPALHDVVAAQAEAAGAAEAVLKGMQQAQPQGQVRLVQVLDAHERLHRHRRAFLAAVEEYNNLIARYALSVAVPAATGERVVTMLIGTGKADRSVLATKKDGSQIRRVSGEEPAASDQGGPVFRTPRIGPP